MEHDTSGDVILEVRDVIKEYPQGERPLRVLKGVSLQVEEGEYLAVVGASGAGKSTLLHIMGLLDTPTSGDVIFRGRRVSALSGAERAALRCRAFGFVFQFFHLLPDFDALENVMMPAAVGLSALDWRRRRSEVRARAEELLRRVGLGERMHHRPSQLSGGERQRVAICRALINSPAVLLLDEPTGNLDSRTGEGIHELVAELNREQDQTVVMVTHDESAAKRARRVLRIRDGEIL